MSDQAAKLILAGMLAIAVALFLSRGIYESMPRQEGAVLTLNKLTGTVSVCSRVRGCEALQDVTD